MAMMSHFKTLIAASLILSTAPLAAARAQTIAGCTSRTLADPPRTVFECAGGLIVEAEAAAAIGLAAPGVRAGSGRALEIEDGAVLLEVAPGEGSFQIRTPHAIASVRGTVYAVDVTEDKTSVFVQKGRVRVTRRDGTSGVTLRPGKGIDVVPGKRLVARTWSASRIVPLLARFGR